MTTDDERIALFLDYENLAIGARDGLGVRPFDFGPIADALAERGRVVARRAYADWSAFDEDRRLLARAQVELIEIPQRMGASRKNAADIKMAVDAIQLASAIAVGPALLDLATWDRRLHAAALAEGFEVLPGALD